MADVFLELGAGPRDRERFWVMYRTARRRGMGCARACYLCFFVLDFALQGIANAFRRSPYTVDSQVRNAYGALKATGLRVRGKGDVASLLMLDVPREERNKPPKRMRDHPLRSENMPHRRDS